jgi:hypothetical protein
MPRKSESKSPFARRWRITWMAVWAQDFVDAEVEGFFEFGPTRFGSFQFRYVQGDIEYREGTRDSKPCVEFCWHGSYRFMNGRGIGYVK